ncbi:IclR family transcriptional regulator [Streptomyces tagetis]|uniref:IclR family transcriptional regulator n=1 Tax=Streptomyces tagetis TaxID=2820809 RepID=A0A940XR63_9ACTN|nr:IclR family transcriptional regulator [Streptomyces sp. RG38]MBQ0828233.1 IclR family transcriptional regulator [Streptomyces sp. RG38]
MSEPPALPPIESVDRALRLLTILHDGTELSATDAAQRLGVVVSTAYRLLSSLVYRGYAVQGRDRRYRLGPALVPASARPLTVGSVRALAHSSLETLHERTSETVQLMVLERRSIRFVDGIESEHPLRVGVRTGEKMPAHCSAGGKALLAAMSNAALDRLYQTGLPPWPTARVNDLATLKRQLVRVRQQGYGRNDEETEQGVSGVGMAVGDMLGQPVAALTVAVPSARFTRDHIDTCLAALADVVAETTERLRRTAPPPSPRTDPGTGPTAPGTPSADGGLPTL